MPMYEYECISCSIRFEVQRSIHDVNIPKCCGFDMRRIYDPVGAIFRGTGWGKDVK
jgi:putative FmdB family regulatory protein